MYEKTYKANVLEKNQKHTPKEGRSIPWRRILIALCVALFLFGFGVLLRHPKFQVTTISIIGTTVIDEADVSKSIETSLQGRWLWVFPRRSVLLVNDKAIERSLKKEFSRIETVEVKRTNLHTLVATIKEFDAVYLWCTTTTDEDCYFMDQQGTVYSRAPVFSGTAYPKIFTGAPLDTLPFQGMKLSEVQQVAIFQRKLSEINITPVAFRFLSAREIQIDFLHNKMIAHLLIDPTVPTDTSLEYLFSGIRTEPLSSLFHNEHKKLLYIDVRFSNKVVYKFEE